MFAVFSKDGYVDLIYIEGGEVCASIGKMVESSTMQVSTGKQIHLKKTNLVSDKEIMNSHKNWALTIMTSGSVTMNWHQQKEDHE